MSSNTTTRSVAVTPTRWVREREAAQVTGFAPGTLRQWRHHGRGPAFHRVGRTVLYDRAELHRFVMAGRVEMASAA